MEKEILSHHLFDNTGRLIPFSDSVVYSKTSRRYFTLAQPKLDLSAIYSRIDKHLNIKDHISLKDFAERAQKILHRLQQDPQTKNLLNAVHVPFISLPNHSDDLSKEFQDVYLKAVADSFTDMFPKYTFTNHCTNIMEGLKIAQGSRYEKLMEAKKKGPVVGWYFPNCLAEYSVPSQREAIQRLPQHFILSGLIDTGAAFVGSPDILMKNTDNLYPHLLSLSAVVPPDEKFFYHFEAYGWNLTFNYRSYVGAVAEYWAGGLTVID